MYKRIVIVLTMVALLVLATQVFASATHDESTDGDLSDDFTNPTSIVLTGGSTNSITASMDPSDKDYLAVNVPVGHELSAVILDSYDSNFGQSFVGVQASSAFTVGPSLAAESDLLGYTLFGQSAIGTDILDNIGNGFGSQGFSGPLPSGDYTFWIQETATDPAYGMSFVVNIDYDENRDGDLSGNRLAPNYLILGPDSNTLEASVFGGTISDVDYVTFRVTRQHWVSEVRLVDYSYPRSGNQSFMALQRGTTFTEDPATADATNLLGATLFGDDQEGTNILDDLAEGANLGLPSDAGVQGFSGILPFGDYTFWIQETGTDGTAQYELEFVMIDPTDIYLPMSFNQD